MCMYLPSIRANSREVQLSRNEDKCEMMSGACNDYRAIIYRSKLLQVGRIQIRQSFRYLNKEVQAYRGIKLHMRFLRLHLNDEKVRPVLHFFFYNKHYYDIDYKILWRSSC